MPIGTTEGRRQRGNDQGDSVQGDIRVRPWTLGGKDTEVCTVPNAAHFRSWKPGDHDFDVSTLKPNFALARIETRRCDECRGGETQLERLS